MVASQKHVRIVKKHPKKWFRHQSDRFMCVPSAWRKPKGEFPAFEALKGGD
jgi:large subunit ribosomal protein L32e